MQATCLAKLRKVEDSSTSLVTRNETIAVPKWGVTIFLATCKKNCLVSDMALTPWETTT